MLRIFRSKFALSIFLLITLLLSGVLGYRILANYDWIDALYMTVITITTVGYSEVRPSDPTTKVFTIALIVSSVFIVAFAISAITEYLISRNTINKIKYKMKRKKLDLLKDHVIICGFGRNGKEAASRLQKYRRPFVVIERNPELIEHYDEDILFVEGNAHEDDVLMEAGIDRATCLISALPKDADNLFVVLSSRQLNRNLHIISRASEESSLKKLRQAGADNAVMPDKIGGGHMASLVVLPDLVEFMNQLAMEGEQRTNLEEISFDDLPEKYHHKSLLDLDIRRISGCTVIGLKQPDGKYIINPEVSIKLLPNSKLMVLGRPEQIDKLNNFLLGRT
ncbi:potassium channel family protein [Robertkochia solimangrovi]|uniref:potassium channel family protein n=1 Tax=Robertkochia solimangrovi TaxID=2213046 RepID=UPI00117D248F|nr:potassium channel protein [Robertkochia solimangrovi]TRZ41482.1 potassium channel protein [Robertkochia solimangrovi]